MQSTPALGLIGAGRQRRNHFLEADFTMAKQVAEPSGSAGLDEGARRKARRNGWLVIIGVAAATTLLFVLGTVDPDTRYDWIKL